MVGGRSGNRGRCAQPCRMAYHITDYFGDEIEQKIEGRYLLSTRDLFGYQYLSELHSLGLAAWKIEGRMKKPQYVATVCRIYSHMMQELDAHHMVQPNDEDLRQLMQSFNRDRCASYWHGNPGAAMMSYMRPNNRGMFIGRIVATGDGVISIKLVQNLNHNDGIEIWQSGRREGCTVDMIYRDGKAYSTAQAGEIVQIPSRAGRRGDRIFKTYDAQLNELAELSYRSLLDKPLSFLIKAQLGESIYVSAVDADGYSASRQSSYIFEKSEKKVTPKNVAYSQLGRLGGTGYCLSSLRCEVDDDALLPPSVLNQLRRELIADLFAARQKADQRRPFNELQFADTIRSVELSERPSDHHKERKMPYSVLVHTANGAWMAARSGIKDIYFDASGFPRTTR